MQTARLTCCCWLRAGSSQRTSHLKTLSVTTAYTDVSTDTSEAPVPGGGDTGQEVRMEIETSSLAFHDLSEVCGEEPLQGSSALQRALTLRGVLRVISLKPFLILLPVFYSQECACVLGSRMIRVLICCSLPFFLSFLF